MSDEPRLTVTLSHDQWQWVMSLVLGSQYLRAKPIVEAVEAAVAQHRAGQQASPQQHAAELRQLNDTIFEERSKSDHLESEIWRLEAEITRQERRMRGYQSQAAKAKRAAEQAKKQAKKQANGTDAEPEPPAKPEP